MRRSRMRWFPPLLVLSGLVWSCSLTLDAEETGAGCPEGFKACGEPAHCERPSPENGCGADNCIPCGVRNAEPICSESGECIIGGCNPGYGDCNENVSDGCEVNVYESVDHCESCDKLCEPEEHVAEPLCARGQCGIYRCEPGWYDCDGNASNGCEREGACD